MSPCYYRYCYEHISGEHLYASMDRHQHTQAFMQATNANFIRSNEKFIELHVYWLFKDLFK